MQRRHTFAILFLTIAADLFSQGVGIPSKRGGIGFGNLTRFTGIRFNFRDKNVERINGINVTVWQTKEEEEQTGDMRGIAIGLPMAMGQENQSGLSVGIFGTGARQNLSGFNFGGLGVGAGGSVKGISIGGLGIGSGGDLVGINVGGLGAGSGGNVRGFNVGGLGIGAGGSLAGFSFGGLGVGSGGNVTGINIGGLGVGSGKDITGISLSVGGIGAGGHVRGISVAGLGVGSGSEVKGLTVAGIGIGGPAVTGIAIASVVGGVTMKGLMIAPFFFRVGEKAGKDSDAADPASEGTMTGISISAYNRIIGEQRGLALGIVNYARKVKGVQFGVINIIRENPKGLRVLPVFNTRFKSGGS